MKRSLKNIFSLVIVGLIVSMLFVPTISAARVSIDGGDRPDRGETAPNRREKSVMEPTPFDQGMNKHDAEITRRIRAALMKEKGLSKYGRNITVVTQDGMVTLRGPVRSIVEKNVIEAKATEVVDPAKVINELEFMAD